MTDQAKETIVGILERYGFATMLACALLYVGRQDIILPMVEAHRAFLTELAQTQHEISKAVGEQTKLLYAMQPHQRDRTSTVSAEKPTGTVQD